MCRYPVLFFCLTSLGVVENLISCDFEDGLCDWSDVSTTEYDWTVHSGKTPDFSSGPPNDHTFNNYLGHYVYANGGRASRTSVAVLRSEEINITNPVNMTFWYYMSGSGIGSLTLLTENMNDSSTIWSKHGRQKFDWQEASVTLHPGTFELVFETTVSRPYGSDIALDDIRLYLEPKILRSRPTPTTTTTTTTSPSVSTTLAVLTCPVNEGGLTLPGSCDFEAQKMCGYNSSKIDDLEWLRNKGYRGSLFGAHITGDHGSVNGTGYYVYLRTDAVDSATGKTATITSRKLNKQTRVCLQFAYTIVSEQETTLRVYSVTSGSHVQLTAITDHEMTSWKVHNVSLCAETNTRIVFEAKKVSYLGFVVLDDIEVTSGICGHKYPVITTPSPPPTTRKQTTQHVSSSTAVATTSTSSKTSSSIISTRHTSTYSTTTATTKPPGPSVSTTIRVLTCPVHEGGLTLPGSCDFEAQKTCGYNSSKIDDLEWLRIKGYRGSLFGAHINRDHGSVNGTGYYVLLRTDGNSANGLKASLTSPSLNKQTRVCLQFAYIIVSTPEVTLKMYTVTSGSRVPLAAITDHKMTSWQVYNISLCAETDTRIVFESTKVAYLGYVAIDDIKVTSGICGHKNETVTTLSAPSSKATNIGSRATGTEPTFSSYTTLKATEVSSLTTIQVASLTASSQPAIIITTSGYISSNHVTKMTLRHHSTTPVEDRQSGGGLSEDNKVIITIAVVVPSFVLIILVVVFVLRNRSKASEIPGSTSVQDVYVTQKSYISTTKM